MTPTEIFEQRFWLLVHALDGLGTDPLGIPSSFIDHLVGIATGKVQPTEADLEQFKAWYLEHPHIDPRLRDLDPLEDWRLATLDSLADSAHFAAIYYSPEVVKLAHDLENAYGIVATERLDRWERLCEDNGIDLSPEGSWGRSSK